MTAGMVIPFHTSLGAEMGLLMSSQRANCIRSYAALPIFYVE
ncbi:hypothetical protein [Vibrio tritonius]